MKEHFTFVASKNHWTNHIAVFQRNLNVAKSMMKHFQKKREKRILHGFFLTLELINFKKNNCNIY